MTQTIQISDETYGRLKKIAEPFVDTEASVIDRLLDFYHQNANGQPRTTGNQRSGIELDPDHPENLRHTRVLRAKFGNDAVPPKWNELVKFAHIKAAEVLGVEKMQQVSRANLLEGNESSRGFKYIPKLDLSIQGLDSHRAWETTLWIARELKVPVEVGFEWHTKAQAAHPGKMGVLRWSPPD